MIINQIQEKPKCENCGKPALGKVYKLLLCGDCIMKWHNKQQSKENKIKMEILNDINGN